MSDAAIAPSELTPLTVAIDGPSGSGKSSVSKAVARALGLAYLDTGAMYRAATLWVQQAGLDFSDHDAVASAVDAMPLVQILDPDDPRVLLDTQDVSAEIRSQTVTSAVSQVATNLQVREVLRTRQRDIIAAERTAGGFSAGRGIVAEGRDITTVVAPDAQVRILLTASEQARLARRALEVHGTKDQAALSATRDLIVGRDNADSTVTEFTVAADGVVTLDSSDLDFDQTVAAALNIVATQSVNEQVSG